VNIGLRTACDKDFTFARDVSEIDRRSMIEWGNYGRASSSVLLRTDCLSAPTLSDSAKTYR
jgi:hypothetical protein